MKQRFITSFNLILFVVGMISGISCSEKEPVAPEEEAGHLVFTFDHHVDGKPMVLDSMMYVNAAGNHYEVNEIMYFISDVTLHHENGTERMIGDWKDIHYVEDDIPATLTWEVFDDLPTGAYHSITFVFGIPEEKNESFMFVNPPENKMMWPDILGGGYHYMMLNGRWLDESDEEQLYNFHLGIGQIYESDTIDYSAITGYIQNYFTVTLPESSFSLEPGQTLEIGIVMNIENWFRSPEIFDFDVWGGAIMEVQEAMHIGVVNGHDVFSTGYIKPR